MYDPRVVWVCRTAGRGTRSAESGGRGWAPEALQLYRPKRLSKAKSPKYCDNIKSKTNAQTWSSWYEYWSPRYEVPPVGEPVGDKRYGQSQPSNCARCGSCKRTQGDIPPWGILIWLRHPHHPFGRERLNRNPGTARWHRHLTRLRRSLRSPPLRHITSRVAAARHALRQPSMARVYADVNQSMPRSYWDYDSVNISGSTACSSSAAFCAMADPESRLGRSRELRGGEEDRYVPPRPPWRVPLVRD